MKTVLHKFITESLFDATEAILTHLQIHYTSQSKTPLSFHELYTDTTSSSMPQALKEVVEKVNNTYLIGAIDENILEGRQSDFDIEKPLDGKYNTMIIFAVDIKQGCSLTRGELATLTRGFNRMAPQLPVIIFIKNGDLLSLATCERSEYSRAGMEGEKLGKVSILRDINCVNPHRGHIDILDSLGDKAYPTFDELYKHWLKVFSSETLTKRFYRELQNWYFAALKVVRFPNDISTTSDDTTYNSEATIRLITRLIFVWFLKQRNLIPGELFDPDFVGNKLLKEFNPIEPQGLFSETQRVSYYYRGILQNLFFATLNTPLTKEGKSDLTERRFKTSRDQFDVNVLMRYRDLFKDPELFIKLCNRVPFLNGGLFDCLDRKSKGLYLDGFSERKTSIDQLCVPDYLFFSDNIHADLSAEYDDRKQKNIVVRGLIKIFNSYQFTIEENTPLDQEVALDPELLGKVFENLLAAFNPETKQTARKQTGSFYTPRPIVQYMVDESLIAHLNRTVGLDLENEYRKLLSYSDIQLNLSPDQKQSIMLALYNCKILDPACGSGAFPMGILQKMVHVLTKIDPDNTQWKEMLLNLAVDETSEVYRNATENERQEAILDIERNFNDKVNRPDYARKLYLIENCIYGVDIQPIAIQISKLRFFISLVIDQKSNDNPAENYGIRPLPNLEAKFVAADSLRSLSGDVSLGDTVSSVKQLKDKLKRINHRLFSVKSHKWKKELEKRLEETRLQLAEELASVGMLSKSESTMLTEWDIFNQNKSAEYFDPEWMFGVKGGFDIVLANPPYVGTKKSEWPTYSWNTDLYKMFLERTCKGSERFTKDKGVVCYITPKFYLLNKDDKEQRKFFMSKVNLLSLSLCNPFDAVTENVITIFTIESPKSVCIPVYKYNSELKSFDRLPKLSFRYSLFNENYEMVIGLDEDLIFLLDKIKSDNTLLRNISLSKRGAEVGKKFLREQNNGMPALIGMDTSKYRIDWDNTYLPTEHKEYRRLSDFFQLPLIYIRRVDSSLTATMPREDTNFAFNKNIYGIYIKPDSEYSREFVVGWLNSRAVDFYYKKKFSTKKEEAFPEIQTYLYEQLPLPRFESVKARKVEGLVRMLLNNPSLNEARIEIDKLIYSMYGLNYEEILIIDPETTIIKEEYERYK
ncbi:MAG: restriction endonuclease subunit M [Bacteroidales bacterium]|nr:restriction endonuclease subunit M [Bacteroidales bacterium]